MAQKKDLQPVVAKDAPRVRVPLAVEEAKPLHKSATVWFNTLIVAAGVVTLGTPDQVTKLVESFIPNHDIAEGVAAIAVAVIGLVNILLRIYKTSQPIQR